MSAKLTALSAVTSPQATDLIYTVRPSDGAGGSHKITNNNLFGIITANIADGALRFGGFAAPTPALNQGSIYYDSATNRFKFSENNGAYVNLGNVTGPGSATDTGIARYSGTTGKVIQDSIVTVSNAGVFGFPSNVRQTFGPGATVSGLNTGSISGDPSTPINGDLWYDSTGNLLRARINGASVSLGAATPPGGSSGQVQWNNGGVFAGVSGFTSDGTNVTAGSGNLRATLPQITTGIRDANANLIIGLSPVGASVNQFTIANAATGGNPTISTTGSDPNIPFVIAPQGTGRLESTGPLRLSGTGTDTYTTPQANSVPTKINVPNFDPGGFGQIVAMGIGNLGTNRRVLSLFDNRVVAHQPTLAVFSPDENNLIGFSWDGSNTIGFIKNTTGIVGLQDQIIQQSGGVNLVTLDTSANAYFGNGIVNAAPANYVLQATGGSGTDIAGANLDLAGGKGTGAGVPGAVTIRYPLIGATGTTLQSLSTDRFPVSVCTYTVTQGSTISNTSAEVSIFVGNTVAPTPSAGSTRTLQGGSARAGTFIKVDVYGTINETGSPQLQFKLKLGGVTIAASAALTITTAGSFKIEAYIAINSVGATAGVNGFFRFEYGSNPGSPVSTAIVLGTATVDLTANADIDITAQWNAGNVLNNLSPFSMTIYRNR